MAIMTNQMLTTEMKLRETLRSLERLEQDAVSRLRIGSPCRFIRKLDIFVHIVIPEFIETPLPGIARYLRNTSPRWGRSWRHW